MLIIYLCEYVKKFVILIIYLYVYVEEFVYIIYVYMLKSLLKIIV